MIAWTVDLVGASALQDPELVPLQRWATYRLESLPANKPKVARLSLPAVEALAVLCEIGTAELIRRLRAVRGQL